MVRLEKKRNTPLDDGFLEALKGSVNVDWEAWEDGVKDEKASDI